MKTFVIKFLLVASLVVAEARAASPESLSAKEAFEQGVALMEKGRHKEAVPYFKRMEKDHPGDPDILWNLGTSCAGAGMHREALTAWLSYRKSTPEDWLADPKIIQAYQALGEAESRDAEIKKLYKRRETDKDPKLQKAERFCREQFEVDGKKVFAFEYFAPKDPRIVYYRFSVLDAEGKEEMYLSLGSYQTTVEVAREQGQLKPNERLYHLDEYTKGMHRTFGFFKEKPGYDDVRGNVVKILKGGMKPVSGITFGK